jgi:hypothetical protein
VCVLEEVCLDPVLHGGGLCLAPVLPWPTLSRHGWWHEQGRQEGPQHTGQPHIGVLV